MYLFQSNYLAQLEGTMEMELFSSTTNPTGGLCVMKDLMTSQPRLSVGSWVLWMDTLYVALRMARFMRTC